MPSRKLSVVFLLAVLLCGVLLAQRKPVQNVSAGRHPNIAAAQRLSQQAFERVVVAQRANEWDLDGHAQKAEELLDQVNHELKQAAEASSDKH